MKDIGWIKYLFESIDAMDTGGFLGFLTDNVRFRFGSAEVVVGKQAVEQSIKDFFEYLFYK